MTTRIKHGLLAKLTAMARQARCPICGEHLGALDHLEWDHAVPLALGGADDASNLRAIHKSCHRAKTSGSKASSAGSDIHKIAKVKRVTGKKAARFSGPPRGEDIGSDDDADHAGMRNGRRYQWPKRKMQSRGFAKGARA